MTLLTADIVQSLSPDAASTAAGRKLANVRDWKSPGQSERAFWGECQGSALYQTRVDRSDYSAKCSCPSRKFPCKHALGLLFLAAANPAALVVASEPQWVGEWLAQRQAKGQQKAEAVASDATKKPLDEKAQAKRNEARLKSISSGIAVTEKWLHDLAQQGLANINLDAQLAQAATRLQDAKAGALAERLRQIASMSERDQAARIDELGYVQWLIDLWHKRDQLSEEWRAELDVWIGLSEREEDVLEQGTRVNDGFFVLGSTETETDKLRERRTWLLRADGKRSYVVLEFLFGTARGTMLVAGSALRGELALYSGRAQQRVVLAQTVPESTVQVRPSADFAAVLMQHAEQLGRSPFARRTAALLAGARVCVHERRFFLLDPHGQALPIAGGSGPESAALKLHLRTGGAPRDVGFCFDGAQLHLLGFAEPTAPAGERNAAAHHWSAL